MIYRPHPCSSSIELRAFFHRFPIIHRPTSLFLEVSTEPIYSFLSDISYIFHPGCSTSLQAVYFGIKTIDISLQITDSKISLVDEPRSLSSDVNLLKELSCVPKPKQHVFELLHNLDENELHCYHSLLSIVDEFLGKISPLSALDFPKFFIRLYTKSLMFSLSSMKIYFKSISKNLLTLFVSHGFEAIHVIRLPGKGAGYPAFRMLESICRWFKGLWGPCR